MKMFYNTS